VFELPSVLEKSAWRQQHVLKYATLFSVTSLFREREITNGSVVTGVTIL